MANEPKGEGNTDRVVEEVLSVERVASVMRDLLAGRISRSVARLAIDEWVAGDNPQTEEGAFHGATMLHGVDLVEEIASNGHVLVHHCGDDCGVFHISDEAMRRAFHEWADRRGVELEAPPSERSER
jgi:hypothetical protein